MQAGGGKSEHQRARCRVTRGSRRKAANSEIHAGGDVERRPDGQCHRKQTAPLLLRPTLPLMVRRWFRREIRLPV